jgi:hypothetical protein
MKPDLPIFAVQYSDSGAWIVRVLSDDPRLPAVMAVAVISWKEAQAVLESRSDAGSLRLIGQLE